MFFTHCQCWTQSLELTVCRASGFNGPQSCGRKLKTNFCLNVHLLHSDCESLVAGHLGVSDGQSDSESESVHCCLMTSMC